MKPLTLSTKRQLVKQALTEFLQGEPNTLVGLVDYLTIDCGIDLERVLEISERQFKIPRHCAIKILRHAYRERYTH